MEMKYLVLAYGAEEDWKKLSKEEQQALLAADGRMREQGALVAAVRTDVATVRNWDGRTPEVTAAPVASLPAPLAGFGIVEAADLDEAVRMVKDTPCARAHGYVELRPIFQIDGPGYS
jgi:hypothetical protein